MYVSAMLFSVLFGSPGLCIIEIKQHHDLLVCRYKPSHSTIVVIHIQAPGLINLLSKAPGFHIADAWVFGAFDPPNAVFVGRCDRQDYEALGVWIYLNSDKFTVVQRTEYQFAE